MFIGTALLLTALAIGSVTSKAAGSPPKWKEGSVAVYEHDLEIVR